MHRSRPAPTSGIAAVREPEAASRRRFLQLLAAISAAPSAHALLPVLPGVSGVAHAQATGAQETPATLRALVDLVKAHWGERLSPGDLRVIEENLDWMQRSSQALRSAPLRNSDEPDVVFRAEQPEDS